MTLTVHENLEQGTDEWLQARCGIVTASVIGQLITTKTVRPASNETSRALTAHLVAERITGHVEPTYVSADMERGNLSEPYARDLYAEHFAHVREVGFMVREWGDGIKLGYSPDGLVNDDGLIEIKAPRQKTHLATILADEVPPQYMAQCQAGLFVSGREWIDYVSYCGGMPLYATTVEPDPTWQDTIKEAVELFEANAKEMTGLYADRTKDAPIAERIDFYLDSEIVI